MVKIISYVLNIAGCGPLSPLFRSASGQREVCFPLNYNRMRNGCQYDMNRYVVMDVEHLCKDIVRVVRDALQALIHLRAQLVQKFTKAAQVAHTLCRWPPCSLSALLVIFRCPTMLKHVVALADH